MELLIASNNKKKLQEIRDILSGLFTPVSLAEKGILSEPEETGTTFEENALIKAKAAADISGLPTLADDSGLQVEALGGEPGVYSARYAGEPTDDEKNNRLLLENMKDKTNRKAKFVSSVVLVFPSGKTISASGECNGILLEEGRGENGFGYDPLFFLPEFGKTMAELSPEEKNAISHRGNALKNLRKKLEKEQFFSKEKKEIR